MLAMSSICLYSLSDRTPTFSAGLDFFFFPVKFVKTSQPVMGNVRAPVSYWPALLGSHWSSRTMEGSFLAPSTNSSRDSLPGRHKHNSNFFLHFFLMPPNLSILKRNTDVWVKVWLWCNNAGCLGPGRGVWHRLVVIIHTARTATPGWLLSATQVVQLFSSACMRSTGRFTVTICVHLPEDLVCAFLWCGLVFGHLHHRGDHLVDGLNTAKAGSSSQRD